MGIRFLILILILILIANKPSISPGGLAKFDSSGITSAHQVLDKPCFLA